MTSARLVWENENVIVYLEKTLWTVVTVQERAGLGRKKRTRLRKSTVVLDSLRGALHRENQSVQNHLMWRNIQPALNFAPSSSYRQACDELLNALSVGVMKASRKAQHPKSIIWCQSDPSTWLLQEKATDKDKKMVKNLLKTHKGNPE